METYELRQAVRIVGLANSRGTIIGRLEDSNGWHYEVRYEINGQSARGWFNPADIQPAATV